MPVPFFPNCCAEGLISSGMLLRKTFDCVWGRLGFGRSRVDHEIDEFAARVRDVFSGSPFQKILSPL